MKIHVTDFYRSKPDGNYKAEVSYFIMNQLISTNRTWAEVLMDLSAYHSDEGIPAIEKITADDFLKLLSLVLLETLPRGEQK